MSVNSSSSLNSTHPPSNLYAFASFYDDVHRCFVSKVGAFSITAYTIGSILIVLPLCVVVLYLGHKQWREQRSSAAISHSDLFTYHMAVADLLCFAGSTVVCCGVHTDLSQMVKVGVYFFTMNISGQTYFHLLTCVERYLAVVHPVTYLSLRKAKGIRIRNITVGCVWVLCIAGTGFMYLEDQVSIAAIYFCVTSFTLIVISFCSLSVLCVLIRPGPGDRGGDRKRVDQTKLRAFYTIMAILGMLLVRVGGSVVGNALFVSSQLGESRCGMLLALFWFCLPSSLVLPLLFLQRAGKLPCCKKQ